MALLTALVGSASLIAAKAPAPVPYPQQKVVPYPVQAQAPRKIVGTAVPQKHEEKKAQTPREEARR